MKELPGAVWAPFVFSAAICGITLWRSDSGVDGWAFSFVCWLPMAFFFACDAGRRSHRKIIALGDRIRELEARLENPDRSVPESATGTPERTGTR